MRKQWKDGNRKQRYHLSSLSMSISHKLDELHLRARRNKWLHYFALFNRIALAAGFLPSGLQKVLGERFTVLSVHHPMGHYLDALYHTGFYYTFIGIMQVTAAILLLIPRTATLGALIYFPIILNICILSFAVRFDGSLLSSPLMVFAVLYLLCWDYHKIKFVFPFHYAATAATMPQKKELSAKLPTTFFAGVVVAIAAVVVVDTYVYSFRPRNTLPDCTSQCEGSSNPKACNDFCKCIHVDGKPLETCLEEYNKALHNTTNTP